MLQMYWHKHEDGSLCVSLNGAYVVIDDLRVSLNANFSKPYSLRARGDARLLLSNEEYLTLLSEYTRYTLQTDTKIEFKKAQVGYAFSVIKDGALE